LKLVSLPLLSLSPLSIPTLLSLFTSFLLIHLSHPLLLPTLSSFFPPFLYSLSDKWRRYTRLDVEGKGGATHIRFVLLRPQSSNNNKANLKTMRIANRK
jgi:hypothetical protein